MSKNGSESDTLSLNLVVTSFLNCLHSETGGDLFIYLTPYTITQFLPADTYRHSCNENVKNSSAKIKLKRQRSTVT